MDSRVGSGHRPAVVVEATIDAGENRAFWVASGRTRPGPVAEHGSVRDG